MPPSPHADLILAIDQGTTGTTVLILDKHLKVLAKKNKEFPQYYPHEAWVEHDLEEIWHSVVKSIQEALKAAKVSGKRIAAIGITNQRETTGIWRKKSGKPIHKALVWQDRRTSPLCQNLAKNKKLTKKIHQKTGLVLDAYFSATKIAWILDHVRGARNQAKKGELAFGTIDTFLVWRLSGGKAHVTDVSNASRTLLMDLKTLCWDKELLKTFKVPQEVLPKIASSSEIYALTQGVPGLPDGIPISGMAGDQQAALFGQACFESGSAKCTYGTGSFILMNTGNKIVHSKNKMLTTVAWQLGKKTTYALEGSAFIAGAAVQWLRDGLGFFKQSGEIEKLATQVKDSEGVVFVPALVGLGAPHWRGEARGLISGLTRATTRAHFARAVLEGIAFLQYDILKAMEKDLGKKLKALKVDGGASNNNLLMQFQSDLLRTKLVRPKMVETTALGAAFLAGLGVGLWKDLKAIQKSWKQDKAFKASMKPKAVEKKVKLWQQAVLKA
ncbi:MAG: glycerol kinase GlpK [Deltaproteobacteria bacterium]|nr:glycerol kinase GlpK [Deltaproteobacteria bacterium]